MRRRAAADQARRVGSRGLRNKTVVYQHALCLELDIRGIRFERERAMRSTIADMRFLGNG